MHYICTGAYVPKLCTCSILLALIVNLNLTAEHFI